MTNEARQIELERESVSKGVERYYETLAADRARDREPDTTVGQDFVKDLMGRFIEVVKELQKTARAAIVGRRQGGGRMAAEFKDHASVLLLDPEKLAYITIRSALSVESTGRHKARMCAFIGGRVNLEVRWADLQKQEREAAKDEGRKNRLTTLKARVKEINSRSVKTWLRRLDDIATDTWDNTHRIRVGMILLEALVRSEPEVFFWDIRRKNHRGQTRTEAHLSLTAEARRALEEKHDAESIRTPWLLPMVCRPLDWEEGDRTPFTGGYLRTPNPLVKTSLHYHTDDRLLRENGTPGRVLRALNKIQSTAWTINTAVLDVVEQALAQGIDDILPVGRPKEMPEKIDDVVWAKMDKPERGEHIAVRRGVHDDNNRLAAKRASMRRMVDTAVYFKDEEAIYFPHNLDFRGRAYPLPQDLHPQADDLGRGLLTFAQGRPLGEGGLRWLVFHLVNCYGHDKVSREKQAEWFNTYRDDIYKVAIAPLDAGLPFLRQAEEPWQFLAACIEVCSAWAHPDGPEAFESRLPVYVDGSCNGLQHLSALGLDPVGAHATNLTSDLERQDIYQIVAENVAAEVNHRNMVSYEEGIPYRDEAVSWEGHITRKVVKRAVMTVPYGLTDIGMRDQLIQDRHKTWALVEGDIQKNATYLRDLMKPAIAETVPAATAIMSWMQAWADTLSRAGHVIAWTTPSGFTVRQGYQVGTMKKIRTVFGRLYVREKDAEATPDVRKQGLAIAPNIIHSFDAAHMMNTIERSEAGAYAVVHDSFGVHACEMDGFLTGIREAFVRIYELDWMHHLGQEFSETIGEAAEYLPVPPEHGVFDIREVRQAEFFFA